MKLRRRLKMRAGLTLIELMLSVTSASVLLVGTTSTLYIALQSANPSLSPAPAELEGIDLLANISLELQHATAVTEQSPNSIRVVVPDRDFDATDDTIRYSWSGAPGGAVTRQYNGGPEVKMAVDVHDFTIAYHQPDVDLEYVSISLQITEKIETRVQNGFALLNRP